MPYIPPNDARSDRDEWALILHAQERVVSAAQARAVGMSADAIRSKVDSGRWQRVHHGVYATFTGDLSRRAYLWAVVLRCGRSAVLSHETAAEIHGLTRGPASKIHVTVPLSSNPARLGDLAGVVVHRSANWQEDPQPPLNLPRTPVAATVLDLVDGAGSLDDAYAWLSRAITGQHTTTGALREALAGRKKISKRSWLAAALTRVDDDVQNGLAQAIVKVRGHQDRLRLQRDAERRADARDDLACEVQQRCRRRRARVDERQGVLGGDPRAAGGTVALGEAGALDEPGGWHLHQAIGCREPGHWTQAAIGRDGFHVRQLP
jgi:hypothetical protein